MQTSYCNHECKSHHFAFLTGFASHLWTNPTTRPPLQTVLFGHEDMRSNRVSAIASENQGVAPLTSRWVFALKLMLFRRAAVLLKSRWLPEWLPDFHRFIYVILMSSKFPLAGKFWLQKNRSMGSNHTKKISVPFINAAKMVPSGNWIYLLKITMFNGYIIYQRLF